MTDHLRILTVRNPWAHAIIHGGKTVENRMRSLGPYRGPVLIHTSLQRDDEGWVRSGAYALTNTMDRGRPDLLGHIIGVVDLVDAHDPTERLFGLTGCQGTCTPWSEMGQWHLVLENPRALEHPIPHTGGLGLRKTDWQIYDDYLVERHELPAGHSCTPMGCPPGCDLAPLSRLIPTHAEHAIRGDGWSPENYDGWQDAPRPEDDSTDPCPEWHCPDLSAEDRREGKTCPEHPCTCAPVHANRTHEGENR